MLYKFPSNSVLFSRENLGQFWDRKFIMKLIDYICPLNKVCNNATTTLK